MTPTELRNKVPKQQQELEFLVNGHFVHTDKVQEEDTGFFHTAWVSMADLARSGVDRQELASKINAQVVLSRGLFAEVYDDLERQQQEEERDGARAVEERDEDDERRQRRQAQDNDTQDCSLS